MAKIRTTNIIFGLIVQRSKHRDATFYPVLLVILGEHVEMDHRDKVCRVARRGKHSKTLRCFVHRAHVSMLLLFVFNHLDGLEVNDGHGREQLFGSRFHECHLVIAPPRAFEKEARHVSPVVWRSSYFVSLVLLLYLEIVFD